MSNATLLHILIAVHTLIVALAYASLFYVFYAALKRHSPLKDKLLLAALVWPWLDFFLLAANGMECPLQNLARQLAGQTTGWVRDVYWVPQSWLRQIPWTFGVPYVIGAALVFWRASRPGASP